MNTSKVLMETEISKEAERQMEAYQAEIRKQVEQQMWQLRQDYEQFQRESEQGALSEEQREQRIRQLQQKEQEIQREQQLLAQQFEKKRAELLVPVNEKVRQAIGRIAGRYDFALIYETGQDVYRARGAVIYDLTPVVVKELKGERASITIDPNERPPQSSDRLPANIAISPEGGVKVLNDDGSYSEYRQGQFYYYSLELNQLITPQMDVEGYQVPDLPPGISSAQQSWITTLNKWVEKLAKDRLDEIEALLGTGSSAFATYSSAEKDQCSNVYEQLSFRHIFLEDFRKALAKAKKDQ
ncbi:MAG: OmpH family outer membrane protein [Planctomycetales bacterium]|nr:OmpH family outer membrane protein [Planctomycetales bacterium]